MAARPDAWPGFAAAFWAVAAVTLLRIAVLAVARTDLWVDEAQYWAWGQTLDWGYFSKPPLIGWVIRTFTEVFGDSAFAIRLPGPLFHAATALVLGRLAQDLFGGRAGLWTALGYVTLPLASLGSLLISTDTILAPFFAAGLLFWVRLSDTGRVSQGVLAGAMIGVATLAKYAGVYFWPGVALAALIAPAWRVRPLGALAALAVFAAVIAPNVAWNLANDLTTARHTIDNAGWLRTGIDLNLVGAAGFLSTQLAVFGPGLFPALLLLPLLRPGGDVAGLLSISLPIIAFVTMQALMSQAFGNWAVTAYFAGAVAVLPWLAMRARRIYWLSLGMNAGLGLLIAWLAIFPDALIRPSGRPYLERYLGRANVAQQVLDLASAHKAEAIVAADRGLLAGLWHQGRSGAVALYSLPASGAPDHYYQQNFPWRSGAGGLVLFVTESAAPLCDADRVAAVETDGTAWDRRPLFAHLLPEACHAALEG